MIEQRAMIRPRTICAAIPHESSTAVDHRTRAPGLAGHSSVEHRRRGRHRGSVV